MPVIWKSQKNDNLKPKSKSPEMSPWKQIFCPNLNNAACQKQNLCSQHAKKTSIVRTEYQYIYESLFLSQKEWTNSVLKMKIFSGPFRRQKKLKSGHTMAGQGGGGVPAMGYAAYMETPPVTRAYATACVLTSAAVQVWSPTQPFSVCF